MRAKSVRPVWFLIATTAVVAQSTDTKRNVVQSDPPPEPTYVAAWEPATRGIDETISELSGWLVGDDEVPPQSAVRHLGFSDPYEHHTAQVAKKHGSRASIVKENWRSYVGALRRVRMERASELLVVSTPQSWPRKEGLVQSIGPHAPHPAFLPLLRDIAANPREFRGVRRQAVYSLSLIPHDDLIPELIQFLESDEVEVQYGAFERLYKSTGFNAAHERERRTGEPWKNDWKLLVPEYREWWDKHKDTFKLNRCAILSQPV